jgi:hypothetical protein
MGHVKYAITREDDVVSRFKTKSKYGSIKTETYDGAKHDSKKEAKRWLELNLLQRAGEISELQRQVPFELIPPQYIDGKCVERSVKYVADFVYTDKNGSRVVEDTKSPATRKNKDYIIKRKLMLWLRGIKVEER